jgi:hypothetical protein
MATHRTLALDRFIPYARNARTRFEAQVTQIAASIKEFGFVKRFSPGQTASSSPAAPGLKLRKLRLI